MTHDRPDQALDGGDEPICVCITGNGLKTVEVMQGQFASSPVIEAKIGEFDRIVKQIAEAPTDAVSTPHVGA